MTQGVLYGEYFLLGRLARGGMAEIFLAKGLEPELDGHLLALKRTLSEFSEEADFVSMFTDEARIASGLHHANICRIFDHGKLGDQRFIVMEFIHGKDLKVVAHRAKQRGEPIPPHYVAFILAKIAEALHFAHQKQGDTGEPENIVHRDVSPQNILVSYDGVPKLIDFGIAKAKDRLSKTEAGVVKGKFAYMSPEQAIGREVDFRTDVFALGVVLYELLVGKLPFRGSSEFSTLKKIASAQYDMPSNVGVPQGLVRVIERALAKDKMARYGSAKEMASDLRAYLASIGKDVRESSLSAYMRKLFRDDYVREVIRIKEYLAIKPWNSSKQDSRRIEAIQPDDHDVTTKRNQAVTEGDDSDSLDEATMITSSIDLAAGYDEEVTGLADLLGGEAGEERPQTLVKLQRAAVRSEVGDDDEFGAGGADAPMGGFQVDIPAHPAEIIDAQKGTAKHEAEWEEDGATRIVTSYPAPGSDLAGAGADSAEAPTRIVETGKYNLSESFADVKDDAFEIDIGSTWELGGPAESERKPKHVPQARPRSESTPRSAGPHGTRPITRPRPQTEPRRGSRSVVQRRSSREVGQVRVISETGRARHRKSWMLSGPEIAVLTVAGLAGVGVVGTAYYLKTVGVPEFAEPYRDALERLTGKLPNGFSGNPKPDGPESGMTTIREIKPGNGAENDRNVGTATSPSKTGSQATEAYIGAKEQTNNVDASSPQRTRRGKSHSNDGKRRRR